MNRTPNRARLAAVVAVSGLVLGLNAQATSASPAEGWQLEQPLDSAVNRIYSDVAATSGDNAWAVGYKAGKDNQPELAIEHYDGKTWADVPPAPVSGPARLDLVSAAAPNDVWAAGSAGAVAAADVREHRAVPSASAGADVVQHWDGTAWKSVERPTPAPGWQSFVAGLGSFGRNSVWLSGIDYQVSTHAIAPWLVRWDGKGWQKVTLPPAPGGKAAQPGTIVGTGPGDISVSADVADGSGKNTPLLYHWDGRVWTVQAVPVPSDYPTGWVAGRIAADPKGGVYAVGRPNEWNAPPTAGFVAHWDGKRWTSVPAAPFPEVNAVTVGGDGRLWTSGWQGSDRHCRFAVWTGREWQQETLPAEGTSHSEQSSVLAIKPVPGTKKLLAAGLFSSNNLTSTWGLLASRGQ
jgi:hypothetical protein